ncbi:MAG: hypothetical protein R3B48_01585 [Kofleriaceae bacterium]
MAPAERDEDEGTELVLDGRFRLDAPIAEGVFLREYRAADLRAQTPVALWIPHREVAPAFEDIEAEIAASVGAPAGCRRVLACGRRLAYVVGASADHVGPRPGRQPQPRAVVAGWFRAVAGIIDRNHQAGRWHGLLTCDDVSILDGRLVVAGFGFWVRTDPEAIAAALHAPEAAGLRALCAPEVAASAIGPSADLWALGRGALALATGASDGDPMAVLTRRQPRFAELLAGLLAEDPDARVTELRELAEEVTLALRDPPRERASQRPVPVHDPDGDDSATARFEVSTGVWSGGEERALPSAPPVTPQTWSPLTPHPPAAIQVISMKEAGPREPKAPRKRPRVAPVVRPLDPVSTPVPAELGTIAPPRARTQVPLPQARRRWPLTLLTIALAILAVGVAAAALWR